MSAVTDLHVSQSRRIACFVLRSGSEEDLISSRTLAESWKRACTWLEFIDRRTKGIDADWQEGYEFLAQKSYTAWLYMYRKYIDMKFDFVLKADIDTYILVDNLHQYMARFNPEEPHYIGRQLVDRGHEFVAGVAIILSRAALARFVTAAQLVHGACSKREFALVGAEDVALGICLKQIGIYPHNTRDGSGRERFMVFSPTRMRHKPWHTKDEWYQNFAFNSRYGPDCCSPEAIAFHKVSIRDMPKKLRYYRGLWAF